MVKTSVIDYESGAILRETLENLHKKLGSSMDDLKVERVVIGIFFTGVNLSNGYGGICFTPIKEIPEAVCCPSSARTMPSSGKFRGRKVTRVLQEMWHGNPLKKAIGIATMNALSSYYWDRHPSQCYAIKKGIDAFDDVEIPEEAYVVVIGALLPILKTLKQRGRPFGILELDPETLRDDELEFYIPTHEASSAINKADILVITGTTLINDTLEDILSHAKPDAHIMLVGPTVSMLPLCCWACFNDFLSLVGPTVSMLPEAFFDRGVKSIGGIVATKPDELLDIISEGGSGYHFFGKFAERIVIEKMG